MRYGGYVIHSQDKYGNLTLNLKKGINWRFIKGGIEMPKDKSGILRKNYKKKGRAK